MATNSAKESINVEEILTPFIQRAAEAEDRLTRLENAFASKNGCGSGVITQRLSELHLQSGPVTNNEDLLKKISELQSQLEETKAKLVLEQNLTQKLTSENLKLQNRVMHLLRSANELTEWKEKSGHYS